MTLIEILAALAVFTIGILTVIRMYPGGFGLLRSTANTTVTARMAAAELERVQNGGGMPAGILSGVFQSDGSLVFIDTDFKNLEDGYPVEQISTTPYKEINKFHFVFEETTIIPDARIVPNLLPGAGGTVDDTIDLSSYYYVKFSPIDVRAADNTVRISDSGPMRPVIVPSGVAAFGSADFAVDYTSATVYVPADSRPARSDALPPSSRRYYISYSYNYTENGVNRVSTVVCQPIDFDVAAGADITNGYQSQTITLPSGALSLVLGSATVRRGFQLLPNDAAWTPTSDNPYPYEFKIIDSVRGILAFNPHGTGLNEYVWSQGQISLKPVTAYMSYGILDGHILHEDKKVPVSTGTMSDTDPALNIKLSLGPIMRKGYVRNTDNSLYMGLSSEFTNLQYDVIVADLDDGMRYSFRHEPGELLTVETVMDPVTITAKPAFTVDYGNGFVRFNPYFYGHSVRIYYRTSGGWGMQAYRVFSAFARVVRDDSNTDPIILNFGQYYRGSNNKPSEYGKLFFPRAYAGLEVSLDYTYLVPGESTPRIVSGEIHRISDTPADGVSDSLCYVDLASSLNKKLATNVQIMYDAPGYVPGPGVGVDDGIIRRVRGVSLGVRVVRKDMGLFQGGRWRYFDLQSSLSTAQ